MIYDSELNVTWYDYTYHPGNGTSLSGAVSWVNSLTVSFNGQNITGWSLPTSLDGAAPFFGHDGTTTTTAAGYNITDKRDQMSYLYYAELGNKGYLDINGGMQSPSWNYGLAYGSVGLFKNLMQTGYWSSQAASLYAGKEWIFNTSQGSQFTLDKTNSYQGAIAVIAGDVAGSPVPFPGAAWLLGPCLIGLIGLKRKMVG